MLQMQNVALGDVGSNVMQKIKPKSKTCFNSTFCEVIIGMNVFKHLRNWFGDENWH